MSKHDPDWQEESLEDEASHVIEESRMILPGIQALFGFQLVAVFNQRFTILTPTEQTLFFATLALVACAVALVMSPAAYHRQAEPRSISNRFLNYSSRTLTIGLFPLLAAINLDFYLIGRVILGHPAWSAIATLPLTLIFFTFWYVIPIREGRRNRRLRKKGIRPDPRKPPANKSEAA